MIGTSIVGASGLASAALTPALARIPGSAVPFTSHLRAAGTVAASQKLSVQVWLRPQVAAARSFAAAVSTPGSASFHQYLSPKAYAARFGAPAAEAASVESWLRSAGFTGVKASPLRSYVRATGAASAIDAAFRTTLRRYHATAAVNAGPYQLRANSTPVSIPASLSGKVLGVTGLDNAAPLLPLQRPSATAIGKKTPPLAANKVKSVPCSYYYGEHVAHGLPGQFGTTSFPTDNCGYSGTQFRKAYGATAADTGTGQTTALVELGLTSDMFLTLKDYAKKNGVPAPSASRYTELSLGQGSACGDPFYIEEQLDVEASYDMAPGPASWWSAGTAATRVTSGCRVCSTRTWRSWAPAAIRWPRSRPTRGAAGTNRSRPRSRTSRTPSWSRLRPRASACISRPATDPACTSRPATRTPSPSAGPRWASARAAPGCSRPAGRTGYPCCAVSTGSSSARSGAAGGGPSLLWTEPAYQDSVVPPALTVPPGNRGGAVRSVPDISADADPFTGFAVGYLTFHKKHHKPPTYSQFPVGGTSESSPLVAGMVSAAQQGQATSFGFVNPALYQLAGSSALNDTLPVTSSSPAATAEWRAPRTTAESGR